MQIIKFIYLCSIKIIGMVERDITTKMLYMASKFPVLTLTGTRQCGKSTLLRNKFGEYKYVSLEDVDIRDFAINDPRGFLNNYGDHLIIDEAQYAPKLFSYIQTAVDKKNESGMYILSGSHNFLLLESVSQSLAGRTAVMKLTPFSVKEMKSASLLPNNLNDWMFTGGFPRIYDKGIQPSDYYPSYIQTYIERDVRLIKNIGDLTRFMRFMKLCAARMGQLLNVSSLASECEISVPTLYSWLSILETSYVVFLLRPYYKNYNKRLVKSPKLYFYDTGLACSLLGLTSADQVSTHYLRGEMFENMAVSECVKSFYSQGKEPNIYFWRDSNGNEVDLLVEDGMNLRAYEIKSAATLRSDFFDGLNTFSKLSKIPEDACAVVYGGDADFQTSDGRYISWRNW